MKTEEAIDWLRLTELWGLGAYSPIGRLEYGKQIDKLIELLRCGEKYEAMFNDIGKHKYTDIEMEKCSIKADYFPEIVNKTITIEIEGNEENISKFTERLSHIVGQTNFGVRTNLKETDKHEAKHEKIYNEKEEKRLKVTMDEIEDTLTKKGGRQQ